jgi:hypothetical protein
MTEDFRDNWKEKVRQGNLEQLKEIKEAIELLLKWDLFPEQNLWLYIGEMPKLKNVAYEEIQHKGINIQQVHTGDLIRLINNMLSGGKIKTKLVDSKPDELDFM